MLPELLNAENYVFNPYALPTLSTAAALLFALFQLSIHHTQVRIRVPLMLALLAATIWLLAFSLMYCSRDERIALSWAKLGYLGVPFIGAAIYDTTVRMYGVYESRKRWVWAGWAISLAFAVLAFDTELIPTVKKYWWGFYPQYGTGGAVFVGYFGVMAGGSLWHYYHAHEQTEAASRKRFVKFISLGILVGCLAGVDFLPKLGVSLYPFGYLCVFISALLIAEGVAAADGHEQAQISEEKLTRSTDSRGDLGDRATRLHQQQTALLSSLGAVMAHRPPVETMARVIEAAADALAVERVAVWTYDPAVSAMQCIHIYRRASHDHSTTTGQVIHPTSSYLGSLFEGRPIVADNMASDTGMKLRDVPADSIGRFSVLDMPLRRDDRLIGVMSYLSIGERRRWHDDEHVCAECFANLLTLFLDESADSRQATARQERSTALVQDLIRELIRRDVTMLEIDQILAHNPHA